MHKLFTSPFLKTFLQQNRLKYSTHLDKALYAIEYHLEREIPRGATICPLHSKSILTQILPKIAKNKHCTILTATNKIPEADIYITEPDGFTHEGAIVKPHETHQLQDREVIAVGSILQWQTTTPATHEYTSITKIITEKGPIKPEHLSLVLNK